MSEVTVKIHRLHPDAALPSYAKPGDSGMDLRAMEEHMLYPGKPVKVDTGIAIRLPDGYEAQVRPRSGKSLEGTWAAWGTIDAGYTGPVAVTLLNVTDNIQHVKAGERVAQLVVMPVPRVTWREVANQADLGVTERGTGGHGHTGVR